MRIVITIALWLAVAVAGATGLDTDRTMDEATARAMLGRFGYGATPAALAATMQLTPREYLMRGITQESVLPPAVVAQIHALPTAAPLATVWNRLGPGSDQRRAARDDAALRKSLQQEEGRYVRAAVQARMLAMANSDNPAHEVLLSFWLNHFSIYGPKALDKLLAADYARAIEEAMAADSFEALLRASFFHPAMQVYLDNAQSTAVDSPAARFAEKRGKTAGINENLARELMELHTLGVDAGYTQQDVQELARIITGAGVYSPRMREAALDRAGAVRRGLFLFDPRRHDFGSKRFLGESFPAGQGLSEIDRALHLLATRPATAQHIAWQLARRFLGDDPPPQVVAAMARGFRDSGGRISATLMPLLESGAFAASLQKPAPFKEPQDYVISVARAVCGDTPVNNGLLLAATTLDMGEAPFMHTTPDGYPTQEAAWLSPAAMAKRVRLAMGAAAARLPFAAGDNDDGAFLKGMAGGARAKLLRGTPCTPDPATVAAMVGPVSATTAAAGSKLAPAQRTALLLASPEFMRR
jgi:uncharacterized protein (DUF1800 family)